MKKNLMLSPKNINSINGHQKVHAVNGIPLKDTCNKLPEILFITSYPPRECGIATYSQDLIKALDNKFKNSFAIKICPLESENEKHNYTDEINYVLNTDHPDAFINLSKNINNNVDISMVMIQHEFGFFENKEDDFRQFLNSLTKPVIIVFHTVLPHPYDSLKEKVRQIAAVAESIIVMTKSSEKILKDDYDIPSGKINVIPHGTHLVPHSDKELLKKKYDLSGKKVLSTFGLISSGKSIETTLNALPEIIIENPDVIFLIIGKTHPAVVKREGYQYRNILDKLIRELNLQGHIRYLNYYLPLPELLDYLQLTDIYLFTSKDPNQAVSGTFSYALSCGCPIVSTPIPHAHEVLKNDAGIIIDFESPKQLSQAVNRLFKDDNLRNNISSNGLHRMAPTAWENSAIAHVKLFEKVIKVPVSLQYKIPAINLDHLKKMTTDFGIIQFAKINKPDIDSGYTLDDNARALVAMCQYFELTRDDEAIRYINIYFNFILHCLQPGGHFLNYLDEQKKFTEQNNTVNLDDSNGRAVWALGYLISLKEILPFELITDVSTIFQISLMNVHKIHSTRAMSFVIKGLYYANKKGKSERNINLISELANRLVKMYEHESNKNWKWFESYLTYANSIIPEAMLCAWLATGELTYLEIAKSSFDFLLTKTFKKNNFKVISNISWLHKGEDISKDATGGEQPIDVAYTILALSKFYNVFKDDDYKHKMQMAFNWFLGANHLHQVIYNPRTGGCYDGLEKDYVNLNQGAESTVSYLMAQFTIAKSLITKQKLTIQKEHYSNADNQYQFV